jgi:membrane-associated phospholipid phosphatase
MIRVRLLAVAIASAAAAAVIATIVVGADWPSNVLAGVLIATAWLSFVVSVRRIPARVFAPAEGQPRLVKSQALKVPIPIPITPPTAASLGK